MAQTSGDATRWLDVGPAAALYKQVEGDYGRHCMVCTEPAKDVDGQRD